MTNLTKSKICCPSQPTSQWLKWYGVEVVECRPLQAGDLYFFKDALPPLTREAGENNNDERFWVVRKSAAKEGEN